MSDLKYLLSRLGLKQAKLARMLGVDPNCVDDWITTKSAPPDPVADFLRYLEQAEPEIITKEVGLLRTGYAAFDDGVYCLSYRNPAGSNGESSELLAVLRSGSMLGSDRWGGVLSGTYRYLPALRITQFNVSMQVPPDGETILGFTAGDGGAMLEISTEFERPRPVSSALVEISGRMIDLHLTYLGPVPN